MEKQPIQELSQGQGQAGTGPTTEEDPGGWVRRTRVREEISPGRQSHGPDQGKCGRHPPGSGHQIPLQYMPWLANGPYDV